ncbi:MAG: major capsid protein, partial [Treponemataceae bacterium]
FPSVAKTWEDITVDPIVDIDALSDEIRKDGNVDVENLIFGSGAWQKFIKNPKVQDFYKNDGIGVGAFYDEMKNKGAKYMGFVVSGNYRYNLWVYSSVYESFDTEIQRPYLDSNKIIFLPDLTKINFQKLFGGIPYVRTNQTIFDQILPTENGFIAGDQLHVRPRGYFEEKMENYVAETKSRPVMLPASIDVFGCLNTVPIV